MKPKKKPSRFDIWHKETLFLKEYFEKQKACCQNV